MFLAQQYLLTMRKLKSYSCPLVWKNPTHCGTILLMTAQL